MAAGQKSYIIVGAGIFGASTALHLIRKYPDASVTLIDREPFPCSLAASWDWNKVIRADYPEIEYSRLALEAKQLWSNDPIYKEFYHQTGMLWIAEASIVDKIANNFKKLGADVGYQVMTVEEAKRFRGGLFRDTDYNGVAKVGFNPTSGWAQAKEALESTIAAAVKAGIKYVVGDVQSLTFGPSGNTTGVQLANGSKLSADRTILSTGAGTAKLLINSAPNKPELHAKDRMIATAVCTACVTPLDDEVAELLKNAPVCGHDIFPGRGGSIPGTKTSPFKFWTDLAFRNTQKTASGHEVSMPPPTKDQNQWAVSEQLIEDCHTVKRGILGKFGDRVKLDNFRICWDSSTPSENFLITPHSASKGLYVATAGSFHGFKFLPVIGKYVVQMLDGELSPEYTELWAWNQKSDLPAGRSLWTDRELSTLLAPAGPRRASKL